MGWLKDRLIRRRWTGLGSPRAQALGLTAAGVCDVCNASLSPTATYFLTTREVVVSEEYWVRALSTSVRMAQTFGLDGDRLTTVFEDQLRGMACQETPWAVCEECGPLFVFDRDAARTHAVEGTRPPGTGPVDPSECAPQAAAAWRRLTGS
ncbi:MAG: hypothetical protein GEV11_13155 [Streptosporangiales bacterium]|nr:hypothetical protein [Streptosporangiales bacterium]